MQKPCLVSGGFFVSLSRFCFAISIDSILNSVWGWRKALLITSGFLIVIVHYYPMYLKCMIMQCRLCVSFIDTLAVAGVLWVFALLRTILRRELSWRGVYYSSQFPSHQRLGTSTIDGCISKYLQPVIDFSQFNYSNPEDRERYLVKRKAP